MQSSECCNLIVLVHASGSLCLGRFIYTGEKWNEHASDCQLVLQSTDEAYDNDSALIRIELNSKEVIGRSCQMLKARLVHGRTKQKR